MTLQSWATGSDGKTMDETTENIENKAFARIQKFKQSLEFIEKKVGADAENGVIAFNKNKLRQAVVKEYLSGVFKSLTQEMSFDDSQDIKRRFLFIAYGEVVRMGAIDEHIAKNFSILLKDYTIFVLETESENANGTLKIQFIDGDLPEKVKQKRIKNDKNHTDKTSGPF